jgi:hypothetical protein
MRAEDTGRRAAWSNWLAWVLPPLVLALVAAFHRWLVSAGGEMTADESFSWRLATEPCRELLARTCNDAHPPGHYLVLKLWMALGGDSLLSLRGLSILLGTACVPLAHAIAKRGLRQPPDRRVDACHAGCCDITEGLGRHWWVPCIPAVLIAFSPLQVEAASTIRMYSQGALLLLVALYFLALPPGRFRFHDRLAWCGYAVAMAAVAYTHNFGLLCMLAVSIVTVPELVSPADARREEHVRFSGGPDSGRFPGAMANRAVWIVGLPLALYSPWMPAMVAQSQWIAEGFWLQRQGYEDWAAAFCYWAVGLPIRDVNLALMILMWVLTVGLDAAWHGDRLRNALLIVAALPWMACWASDFFLDRPLLQERYMTFCQLGLLLLQGLAFVSRSPFRFAARVAAGLLLLLHVSSGIVERPAIRHEPVGLREAVERVSGQLREGDLVVHDFTETYNAVRYYLQRDGFDAEWVRFPAFHPMGERILGQRSSFSAEDYIDLRRIPDGARRVWLISRRPSGHVPVWRSIPSAFTSVPSIEGRSIEVSLWVPSPDSRLSLPRK